ILISVISAITITSSVSFSFAIAEYNKNSSVFNENIPLINSEKNVNTTNEIKPLVPSQANGQNSFLSTSQGPLVYWNNKISSLDWFGAERWSIDFSSSDYVPEPSGGYTGSWRRAWFNWDYDRNRDILWVLGYGDSKTSQKIFSFNATTGKKLKEIDTGSNGILKFVSALSSGNVLMWDGATDTYNATAKLYDVNSDTITQITGDSVTAMDGIDGGNNFKWYFTNTIPIKSGYNLVVLMSFSRKSTTGDAGAAHANYNVYFVLVDDSLNLIAKTGEWSKGRLVSEGLQGYRNTSISVQRDYYQLIDGTVATIIYDKIVMINPNDVNVVNNVSFSTFAPSESKWILSWSFDTSENLFFKYKNDTKIYKVGSANLKGSSNSSVTASTYYDLSSSGNAKIKQYALSFVLYNVYGYQGQIMLVNAWYDDYINIYDKKVPDVSTPDKNTDEYGLVAAITQNPSNPDSGDSKGLLNTADAFQFSADFSIPDTVLKLKLPSEIVKDDLEITNQGFITQNPKYITPFTKVMDDKQGTLTVTAWIDQIPWFVTNGKMPDNINPTEITKTYDNLDKIDTRISWKDSNTDYDFKNTLPSKVDDADLKRFDPATFNINSQNIVNGSGEILYPKKTYSILSRDDSAGNIIIQAKYDYMPLGVDGIASNAKSETVTHAYTIFNKNSDKHFAFTGATTNNQPVDIKNVPQLSGLLESQILPSTFVSSISSSTSGYLQFVNTDLSSGYPTSKMNFSFTANDDAGTLQVSATLPAGYYEDISSNSFTQTYTGLNRNQDYSLNWKSKPDNIDISKMLASQTTESVVFNSFLTYKGFNPLDMNVQLFPDDELGTLNVNITLQGQYNDRVKTANGFRKLGSTWMTSYRFTGFLTKEQQNNQYKLTFKNDNDTSLNDLKKYTAQQIYDGLVKIDSTGLTVGETKYTDLKNLVSKLLISNKGVSLPEIIESNVNVQMYYNNGNGTADFVVQYPDSVNNLIFVGSFTGFVLGNDVVTNDVLSFKTQLALQTEVNSAAINSPLYKFFDKNVAEVRNWLESSNNMTNLISYTSGQYSQLLANKNYTLKVTTNEIYGSISAILEFDKSKLTNQKSVSVFAFTYSGFKQDTDS
nr:hypothetical protein [Malacoplasma sp.]